MVRWEPGARDRLRAAALELYASRGFDETTAADIAASVGLSERTFFRHFADKREVIFNGQDEFESAFVDRIAAAPEGSPMNVIANAVVGASDFFDTRQRDYSILRQSIIEANPSLRERELLKMTALAERMAAALRARGVAEPQASLAAQSGVTVFGVSFRLWLSPGEQRSLAEIERATLADLRSVTLEAAPAV
ncbi:TetR family transcriptional regulator [Frondihabitans australicus]|uniref:TetR family transcriptional regulator n=1 Tax=Frondihabitans australicus TaxID=386892 RepID=A0A495IEY4_9MICO|nr:TetR family transcriptional regulator [Frondihabitans australicus]RKR73576.1 TetR family transcriptional regulator [Frondihabitans australicus]